MNSLRIIVIVLSTLSVSCSIDNYDPPNGGIHGKLIDKITNKNFQTQQPNGYNVLLFEKGGSQNIPLVITGKPNGTFENSNIFQNEYKVIVTEGAFFPMDTVIVQIGERTEVDFEVMPYVALTDVDVIASTGKIITTYNIARQQAGGKILDRMTLVSEIPTVNNVVFDYRRITDLSTVDDQEILADTFVDEIDGLTSGKKYYIRVAARIQSALGRYNYSEAFEVTIP
ncbi:hypothetical protein GCM10007415_07870 [Parapedobacter pyrenivorans]|uniref:DUF3823 domain-containing protein n=1 Tax=Parapedobacter pyrenivorans TaxID=1305674 RepID=A0A917HH26_9SPHI|nr:DUF3823 domain-containing protein [Parapedobacter pyrenivorans]GGG78274.1 hypothetical protein GCM10007415_07870 [Parapedobacter pyrenivorans]